MSGSIPEARHCVKKTYRIETRIGTKVLKTEAGTPVRSRYIVGVYDCSNYVFNLPKCCEEGYSKG